MQREIASKDCSSASPSASVPAPDSLDEETQAQLLKDSKQRHKARFDALASTFFKVDLTVSYLTVLEKLADERLSLRISLGNEPNSPAFQSGPGASLVCDKKRKPFRTCARLHVEFGTPKSV